MSNFESRQKLFDELHKHRKRRTITFFTSQKKPEQLFATQIAQDALPLFYEILKEDNLGDKIDLLLHSSGGQIDTPWPLINLIREYCKEINVLVPWKAHSAATLIALGADVIEMGSLASLSPIDPQFQIKIAQKDEIVAGVEDIYGYYSLIKETLELDSNGRAEALKILAGRISPEVLGKISRTRKEIRIIAENLLELHMKNDSIIKKIVAALVLELPSHQYFVNRREAKDMGLSVVNMDATTEDISFKILNSYRDETKMDEPGISISFTSQEPTKSIELSRAFIETRDKSFAFISKYIFHRDKKVEREGDRWKRMV